MTNVSGRGVGMDVVKSNLEKIGGAGTRVGHGVVEELPETLVGVARELVRGACRLDDALLLWLDAQGAVELQPAG